MKTSAKIKGILGMAGLTYEELAKISDISRQTLHGYLNDSKICMEDLDNGLKVMNLSDRIMGLCSKGLLPLPKVVPKAEVVDRVKAMLTHTQ